MIDHATNVISDLRWNPHTPLPWVARGVTVFPEINIALSVAVAERHRPEARANAKFIAYACNNIEAVTSNHDALAEALRQIDEYRHMIYSNTPMCGFTFGLNMADIARAALARPGNPR